MGWNSGTTRSPSLRVLVVDDSVDLARLVTWCRCHCGFDAQMVFDGRRVRRYANLSNLTSCSSTSGCQA